ncbi:hypothetical protein [Thermotalea metallivorans]|uniref:Uncharacterized protein n=1 Tax=Thermotalea metallivorans TaxID=520762 RepID=A0A140L3Z9_9FIRM|nr:hypothetical protein [Thermotalea metallivorans]KXG75274.1 hypothetical protein AN619_18390 [Thermotalea metallivorans]
MDNGGFYGVMVYGIPEFLGETFLITHDEKKLLLKRQKKGLFGPRAKEVYGISLSDVLSLDICETEALEKKKKSILVRGTAGGLAFGWAGVIAGVMSGVGSKHVAKKKHYAILELRLDGKSESVIFELDGLAATFAKMYKKLLDMELSTL